MTESHDDRTPVEHDPTGMRALLAGLPEPGPMPDDLVARITAALAAEADAGATGTAPPSPLSAAAAADATPDVPGPERSPTAGATVVPLHRRRVRLRHLGVAAAVVGAVGLGGLVLSTTPNDLTASIGGASGADSAQDAESAAAHPGRRGAGHRADRHPARRPGLRRRPRGALERRRPRRRRGRRRSAGSGARGRRRRRGDGIRRGSLVHHGHHRPHQWPGAPALRCRGLARGARHRRGALGRGTPRA